MGSCIRSLCVTRTRVPFAVGVRSHRTVVGCAGCSCQFATQLHTSSLGGTYSKTSPWASNSCAPLYRSCSPTAPWLAPAAGLHWNRQRPPGLASISNTDSSTEGSLPHHANSCFASVRAWNTRSGGTAISTSTTTSSCSNKALELFMADLHMTSSAACRTELCLLFRSQQTSILPCDGRG